MPGLKFSLTMSAVAISLSTASIPSGVCRSSARLFLLRLNIGKNPAPEPISLRVASPSRPWPIGSTLMTSAPRSASTMPQVGPITMCVNSTIRKPAYGRRGESGVSLLCAVVCSVMSGSHVAPQCANLLVDRPRGSCRTAPHRASQRAAVRVPPSVALGSHRC